jgi:DNA-binding LacI/PurR family transcriptional regulator
MSTGGKAPTMSDVAAAAGVSRSTVSLALRNSRNIPPTTRSRVYAVAERLGYKTNPLVSALMASLHKRRITQKHTVLAYVSTDPKDAPWRGYGMFIEMHEGASERALEMGYRLEEFALRAPGMTPRRFSQMLHARGILGLLIAPLPHGERSIELDFSEFAVVGIDMSVASPTIERVSNDHFQSALLAVEHCRALGYRRIGFAMSHEINERLEKRWLAACQLAREQFAPEDRVAPLITAESNDIITTISAWYEKQRPDVVITGELNPNVAYPLPPGVGIVGLSLEEHSLGKISGIFQDNRKMGAIAIEHLVARLERGDFGPDDRGRLHLVAGQWRDGLTAPGPGKERRHLI